MDIVEKIDLYLNEDPLNEGIAVAIGKFVGNAVINYGAAKILQMIDKKMSTTEVYKKFSNLPVEDQEGLRDAMETFLKKSAHSGVESFVDLVNKKHKK